MKFSLLYPDPPWRYNFSRSKSRLVPYRSELLETMCKWPILDIVADDALCFMWATWPKLEQAMLLLKAWGFTYTTNAFVWRKLTVTGKETFNGGRYTRANTEVVLIGKRGAGVPIVNHSVRQIVNAPVREHSRKPQEVADGIHSLVGSDALKLELFARKEYCTSVLLPNFHATGLEYDGRTIVEAIEYYKELP